MAQGAFIPPQAERACARPGCHGSTNCRCRHKTRSAPAAASPHRPETDVAAAAPGDRWVRTQGRGPAGACSAERQPEAPRQQMSPVHAEYTKRPAQPQGYRPAQGQLDPQGRMAPAPRQRGRRPARDSGFPPPPGQLTGRHDRNGTSMPPARPRLGAFSLKIIEFQGLYASVQFVTERNKA